MRCYNLACLEKRFFPALLQNNPIFLCTLTEPTAAT